ncbi:MAG: LpqB family beta-propeller domain-containing protein [Actinomycetaceae bacterium]|nr:LpqB family beta-propeller domain-containing protein [Actinomycetaceae bacterium]
MNSKRFTRLLTAAVTSLVVVPLSLTSCQSLPTSGPVTKFELAPPDSASLQLKGYGPVEDDSPEGIVRDFLRASAAGWSDDFQVARTYLTDEARKNWQPDAQVQIYANDQVPMIAHDGDQLQVETSIEGVLTSDGQYRMQYPATPETFNFTVVQNPQRQWRIQELPAGVVVSQTVFETAFQQSSVYYLSPDASTLVGDQRWFPRRRLAGYLMQSLLQGPSQQLSPAVISAVPEGAKLPLRSVDIQNGRALVELEGPPLSDTKAQEMFQWQVNSTLVQVANASEARIKINGIKLSEGSLPPGLDWAMGSIVSIRPDGLAIDGEVVLDATQMGTSVSFPTIGPLASSPLVYLSGGQLMYVARGSTQPTVLATVADMTRPSVDRLSWVWFTSAGAINAANPGHGLVQVQATWAESGDRIVDLAVSPDGAKALVTRGGKSPSLWVAAIRRSADGKPISLEEPTRIEGFKGTVLDSSWSGNNNVIILVKESEEKHLAISNMLMPAKVVAAPSDAVSVSAGASTQTVILRTSSGSGYTRSGASWRYIPEVALEYSYPR